MRDKAAAASLAAPKATGTTGATSKIGSNANGGRLGGRAARAAGRAGKGASGQGAKQTGEVGGADAVRHQLLCRGDLAAGQRLVDPAAATCVNQCLAMCIKASLLDCWCVHGLRLSSTFLLANPLTAGWLQVDARRAERAERAKLKGNEAFKAGRYMDAIKAYSEALQLQPNHPVYASNRAMAYLKIFRWGPLPLGLLIARLACCSASS